MEVLRIHKNNSLSGLSGFKMGRYGKISFFVKNYSLSGREQHKNNL